MRERERLHVLGGKGAVSQGDHSVHSVKGNDVSHDEVQLPVLSMSLGLHVSGVPARLQTLAMAGVVLFSVTLVHATEVHTSRHGPLVQSGPSGGCVATMASWHVSAAHARTVLTLLV
jgi:hypothetical protein